MCKIVNQWLLLKIAESSKLHSLPIRSLPRQVKIPFQVFSLIFLSKINVVLQLYFRRLCCRLSLKLLRWEDHFWSKFYSRDKTKDITNFHRSSFPQKVTWFTNVYETWENNCLSAILSYVVEISFLWGHQFEFRRTLIQPIFSRRINSVATYIPIEYLIL